MESKLIVQLVILVILIMGSAFFSATETALMSLSKIRLRHMADSGSKKAKMVETLKQEPNKLLGSILLGNNAVNIAASSVATALAIDMMGPGGVGVVTVVMTVVILIFGEITPKSLAMEYSEKISLLVAPIIMVLVKVSTPFVWVLTKITNVIIKMLGGNPNNEKPFITEEELKTIVNVSSEEGLLENDEKEMIYNIFEYGDLRVKDIMIQRMDVLAVSIDATYKEIVEVFEEKMFSRLPVYDDTIDNIVGILYAKDILFSTSFSDSKFDLESLMRAPFQTFEFIKISDFFKQMQRNQSHMAIVLDEYGGVAGIITMEDIVESILGDINDEYDEEDEDIEVIKENEYVVNGYAKLDEINDMLGVNLESEEFESIGGFLIGVLGRLPKDHEIITYHGIKFNVERVDKNRISKIRIFT